MSGYTLNRTFEMNGIVYETDAETLEVLRTVVPSGKVANDMSAVAAVMFLGLKIGRIREIGKVAQ